MACVISRIDPCPGVVSRCVQGGQDAEELLVRVQDDVAGLLCPEGARQKKTADEDKCGGPAATAPANP